MTIFPNIQVSTNGLISFGRSVSNPSPEPFPTSTADVFWSYIAAPFWSNISTTTSGSVSWELINSDDTLTLVSNLIQAEVGDNYFSGMWMLVAYWENVQSPNTNMVRKVPM